MKKIIYLFLLTGYFGYSQPYKIENDELKGNVKSLELFNFTNNNTEELIEYKTFDKKGRILVSIVVDSYYIGFSKSKERNQYSDNQIITEYCDSCDDLDKAFANFSIKENKKYQYTDYDYVAGKPNRIHKIIKTTDKNGNVISAKTYSSEGYFLEEKKSTYDKNSNLLLEETFDDTGKKIKGHKKNIYNNKGLLIEFDRSYEGKRVFEYDDSDRKIFEKRFYETDTDEITFGYDDLGRILFEKYNNNSEVVYEYTTTKDTIKVVRFYIDSEKNKQIRSVKTSYNKGENKVTEEQSFEKGEMFSTKILEYDENKNLISIKFYNKNGYHLGKELVYDKKGNWIEIHYSTLINVSYKPEWRTEKYIRKIQYH